LRNSRLRHRFVILLLLSSILTIIPTANSQQFTTSTSFLTTLATQTTTYSTVSLTTTTSTGAGAATFTEGHYSTNAGAPCEVVLLGTFNSTGPMHFGYSVNGQTTLYILSGRSRTAMTELRTVTTITGCSSAVSLFGLPSYTRLISGFESGSFDLNLPPTDNPYIYAMITPASQAAPNGRLTISPLWGTYTVAMNFTAASTELSTVPTTLISLTSMEAQSYGSSGSDDWIIGLCIVVLIVLFAVYLLHRRRPPTTNP